MDMFRRFVAERRRAITEFFRIRVDHMKIVLLGGHPLKLSTNAMLKRYDATGDTTHLDNAIQTLRDAPLLKSLAVWPVLRLSALLHIRYQRLGGADDIEEALSLLCRAFDIRSNQEHDKLDILSYLGIHLQNRFDRVGALEDLEAAISVLRCAVELMPDSCPNKPALVHNLSRALHIRFERIGEIGDLETAISVNRRAVERTPDGHPNKPAFMNSLGNALMHRFRRVGKLGDLETAISVQRRAIELTPNHHPDILKYMFNLGDDLLSRFERVGNLGDLQAAITLQLCVLKQTPDGYPDKPSCLTSLGYGFRRRFQRLGELEYLEAAILAQCRAAELIPDGHPGLPNCVNELGIALTLRFEHVGDLSDIHTVIWGEHRAVELMPDGHPSKPDHMNTLSSALHRRFERTGNLGDIQAAISMQRHAVDLTPDDHPVKPMRMNNLCCALRRRFERIGELGDLEDAISVQRRAIELAPDDHPDKPMYMNNLGCVLRHRFDRVGKLGDLEAAISVQRSAVDLTPDDRPDKVIYMNSLGVAIQRRFLRVGYLGDFHAAISVHRRAVELMPDGHPDIPVCLTNLGNALQNPFERVGKLENIEAAILVQRRAVELTPDGHPGKPEYMNNLGGALKNRFERVGELEDLKAAYKCFMDASIHSSGSPFIRFNAARKCVGLAIEDHGLASGDMLLQAHSNVLRLLPEVVWLGYSVSRRYEESSKLANCVNDAVFAAIEHEALPQAVAWLEEGRSLVWSQILALRSPLDVLEMHHPELSQRLQIIQQRLQKSGHISRSLESAGQRETTDFVPNEALDNHRGISIEYDRILSAVRSCAGFENFLRPKPFSALLPSTNVGDGYVVFINVHKSRCDALILAPSGVITTVALPDLSKDRALKLHSLWTRRLRDSNVRVRAAVPWSDSGDDTTSSTRLLELMWKWIVHPILLSMDIIKATNTDPLPHITWCPTGPLTQLPLHAAGVYSSPDGPRLYNHVVSSYTSSLSALLRSSEGLAQQQSSPRMLVVTQPETPNQSRLPGTVAEGLQLEKILGESQIPCAILEDKQATVGAVRSVIDQHSWVHLACHGLQHTGDATQSAFYLYDGPLSLSDLMQTAADGAELAFLSACQTATGDEKNPEESVHLAAGMLAVGFKGVVATMWSIGDKDAPIVVEAYYKKLLELRRKGAVGKGQTGAAYALHDAVKVLRDKVGEESFLSWAPFVHFGA